MTCHQGSGGGGFAAIYLEAAQTEMPKTSVLEKTPKPGRTSLDLTGFTGLSEDDARRNIAEDGLNEIASHEQRSLFAIVIEVVREPMFLMLVAAGALYLVMGSPGDALMLLGFVFVVMAITIIQERRTERALDALRDLSSPRALVIRGGVRHRIPYLVGGRLRLHTIPTFFAILGGIQLFGPAGLILGPVALAVTIGLLDVWGARTTGGRTADETPSTP